MNFFLLESCRIMNAVSDILQFVYSLCLKNCVHDVYEVGSSSEQFIIVCSRLQKLSMLHT